MSFNCRSVSLLLPQLRERSTHRAFNCRAYRSSHSPEIVPLGFLPSLSHQTQSLHSLDHFRSFPWSRSASALEPTTLSLKPSSLLSSPLPSFLEVVFCWLLLLVHFCLIFKSQIYTLLAGRALKIGTLCVPLFSTSPYPWLSDPVF